MVGLGGGAGGWGKGRADQMIGRIDQMIGRIVGSNPHGDGRLCKFQKPKDEFFLYFFNNNSKSLEVMVCSIKMYHYRLLNHISSLLFFIEF